MKKILLLFSAVGLLSLTGCNNDDDHVDNDTINEVFQVTANFTYNADQGGKYTAFYDLNPDIYPGDMILIYRRTVDPEANVNVWQLIPRTLYFGNIEVDYDFNFTQGDILFLMDANIDLATRPDLTQNQVFRVVILPGYDNTNYNGKMDFSNYETVAKTFHLKETDVKVLK